MIYDTGFLFGYDAILNRGDQLSKREITLEFLTPTRIKFEGKLTSQVQFHNIIRALLRRISLLCYFHCNVKIDLDYKGIIEKAKKVECLTSELHWAEQTRYSGRQKSLMKMGGLVGKAIFRGELQPFLPLLAAGEYLHVGKGCVMGLGKYVIR
ncbi:MAG: CRISPR system precrRNA processing endoribonuclease RAMP protein Cas6 [Methanosarcinales archaeon]